MIEPERTGKAGPEPHPSTFLGTALKAMSYQLCDRCLGRLFAKYGFGLSNEDRGKAVRIALAIHLEGSGLVEELEWSAVRRLPIHHPKADRAALKDVIEIEGSDWVDGGTRSFGTPWKEDDQDLHGRCWTCQGAFERLDALKDLVISSSSGYELSSFQIGCRLDPGTADREERVLNATGATGSEPISEELNREVGKRVHALWTDRTFDRSAPEITFIIDPLFMTVELQVKPIFIFGRYRKLQRGIPQTRWPCSACGGKGCDRCGGTGKMYRTSVEEQIGEPFKEAVSSHDYVLHGMGREDIDVITVGNGRPFILELTRPMKRSLDLSSMGPKVSAFSGGMVEVDSLRMAERSEIPKVKDGAHLKRYRAKVSFGAPLDEATLKYNISLLAQSPIKQRTPERVSHRRADKVRERSVHRSSATLLPDGTADIEFLADGGLYIKELLHGDEGRTDPSLSSLLGTTVSVISLDVVEVLYEQENQTRKG
ncbi:MAG: tRNA pseudouridine(54/55) synthase Pus10 [Candidatus Thermoplasmatota archaeon]|jgi:tRNA pseudouridine synthase 10|nr:tRNA pseudouridine(54/55) synthase Pus10 [Candidatus Thermoplasmatota archaeon]